MSALLVVTLAVLLCHPFLEGRLVAQRLLETAFAVAILGATHQVIRGRGLFALAVGLAVVGLGSNVVVDVVGDGGVLILRYLLTAAFLTIVAGAILVYLAYRYDNTTEATA